MMISLHSLTSSSTLLLLVQTLALYTTPTLSQRQKDSDYTLLESTYNPLVSELDKELKPLSFDHILDNAKHPTTSATVSMKAAKWYSGGFRFGKDVVVSGDDEEWEAYGISTIADSGYKSDKYKDVTAVSWGNENGGLRVTFFREDLENNRKTVYGHALLVEPEQTGNQKVISFRKVESDKKEHGLVWKGDWLLVTGGNVVRGFDLKSVYSVRPDGEVGRKTDGKYYGGGYDYVIPQAKTFQLKNKTLEFQMTVAAHDTNCTASCLVLGSTSDTSSYFARYEFPTTSNSKTILKTSSNSDSEIPAVWAVRTNIRQTRGWTYAGSEAYISSSAEDIPDTKKGEGYGDLLVWKPGQYPYADEYNNYIFGKPQSTSYDPESKTLYTIGRIPNTKDNGEQYLMAVDLSLRNFTAPTVYGGGPVTVTTTPPPSPPSRIDNDEDEDEDKDKQKDTGTGTPTPPLSSNGSKSLPQGAIAGIAVGCIAIFFGLAVSLYLYLHHRRYSSKRNGRAATATSQRRWNEKGGLGSTASRGGKGAAHVKGTHIELAGGSAPSSPYSGGSTTAGVGSFGPGGGVGNGTPTTPAFGSTGLPAGKSELECGNVTTVTAGHGPFGTGFASPVSPTVQQGGYGSSSWQELGGSQRFEAPGDMPVMKM